MYVQLEEREGRQYSLANDFFAYESSLTTRVTQFFWIKRLAADGRDLQTTHINESFAKLAETLYTADLKVGILCYERREYCPFLQKAREAVDMRAKVEIQIAEKQKEENES